MPPKVNDYDPRPGFDPYYQPYQPAIIAAEEEEIAQPPLPPTTSLTKIALSHLAFSTGAAFVGVLYPKYLTSPDFLVDIFRFERTPHNLNVAYNIFSGIGLIIPNDFLTFQPFSISNSMKYVAQQIVTLSIFTFLNYAIFPMEYDRLQIPAIIGTQLILTALSTFISSNRASQLFHAALPYTQAAFSHIMSLIKPPVLGYSYSISLKVAFNAVFHFIYSGTYINSLIGNISAITAIGLFSLTNEYPDTISKGLKFISKQIMTLSIFTFLNYKLFIGNNDFYLPLLIGTQLTLPFLSRCFSLLTNKISNLFHFRLISFPSIQMVATQIAFLNKCFWYSIPLKMCLIEINKTFITEDSFGLEKTFFQNAIINIPAVCGLRIMGHFIDGTPSNISTSFIAKQITTLSIFILFSYDFKIYDSLHIPTLIGTQLTLLFLPF